MKRFHVLLFVLFVTGLVRGDASVTREQDPLTVNSKTIALKLENTRVRVLEATLKPGDKEKKSRRAEHQIQADHCRSVTARLVCPPDQEKGKPNQEEEDN